MVNGIGRRAPIIAGLALAALAALPGPAGPSPVVIRDRDAPRRRGWLDDDGAPWPRQHDAHVDAFMRNLNREKAERAEAARRAANAERDRPIMEAAEAKRARKAAKRLAARPAPAPKETAHGD